MGPEQVLFCLLALIIPINWLFLNLLCHGDLLTILDIIDELILFVSLFWKTSFSSFLSILLFILRDSFRKIFFDLFQFSSVHCFLVLNLIFGKCTDWNIEILTEMLFNLC